MNEKDKAYYLTDLIADMQSEIKIKETELITLRAERTGLLSEVESYKKISEDATKELEEQKKINALDVALWGEKSMLQEENNQLTQSLNDRENEIVRLETELRISKDRLKKASRDRQKLVKDIEETNNAHDAMYDFIYERGLITEFNKWNERFGNEDH